MDILIMILLFGTTLLIWRGAEHQHIIVLWVVGLVAMLALFRYHVTSILNLSF
jgi:Family of unknown function (DUF5993)